MGSVPFHDAGTFPVTADLVITGLALVGLRRLWREQRTFALWLVIGLAFLLVWPTKWPQYVLVVSAPLSLAAGLGAGSLLARRARLARGPPIPSRSPPPRRAASAAASATSAMRRRGSFPASSASLVLAVIPLAYELLMSLTDLRLRNLRDGLQGGVIREGLGGLAGQIPAVPFDFDQAGEHVVYVGADLLNGFQQGFWFGQNTLGRGDHLLDHLDGAVGVPPGGARDLGRARARAAGRPVRERVAGPVHPPVGDPGGRRARSRGWTSPTRSRACSRSSSAGDGALARQPGAVAARPAARRDVDGLAAVDARRDGRAADDPALDPRGRGARGRVALAARSRR